MGSTLRPLRRPKFGGGAWSWGRCVRRGGSMFCRTSARPFWKSSMAFWNLSRRVGFFMALQGEVGEQYPGLHQLEGYPATWPLQKSGRRGRASTCPSGVGSSDRPAACAGSCLGSPDHTRAYARWSRSPPFSSAGSFECASSPGGLPSLGPRRPCIVVQRQRSQKNTSFGPPRAVPPTTRPPSGSSHESFS